MRDGMSPAHLANVRKLPSCVSGRTPCDAHHLFGGPAAKERGVGMRATDKWVVPLTRDEHMQLHERGSRFEGEWFAQHGIEDPYGLAQALWRARDPRRMEKIVRDALLWGYGERQ